MAVLQRPALPFPRTLSRPSSRLWIVGALAVLAAGALAQVHQFSTLTSTGYEIEQLEHLRTEKLAANHELEAEVAQLSSLARVDWEARVRLGMQPATRRFYIEVNQAPPEQQRIPTRFLPDAAPDDATAARSPSLWQRLRDVLPF
jgi:hypothetical protein